MRWISLSVLRTEYKEEGLHKAESVSKSAGPGTRTLPLGCFCVLRSSHHRFCGVKMSLPLRNSFSPSPAPAQGGKGGGNQKNSPSNGPEGGESCFSGWSGVRKLTQMKTPRSSGTAHPNPESLAKRGRCGLLHALPPGFPAVSIGPQHSARPLSPRHSPGAQHRCLHFILRILSRASIKLADSWFEK